MSMDIAVNPSRPVRPLTGGKVLLILVLFFGTIFGVNGLMIHYAISTFPGLEDNNAYEHGLVWDKDIAAAHEQDARAWQATGTATRRTDGQAELTLVLKDAAGVPVTGSS